MTAYGAPCCSRRLYPTVIDRCQSRCNRTTWKRGCRVACFARDFLILAAGFALGSVPRMANEKHGLLPWPVKAVSDPKDDNWDGIVLVCENLDWECDTLEFLKAPIQAAAKIDKAVHQETLLFPLSKTGNPSFLVHAPTGPVNRDYDDVRRYGDAATSGIKRALKAGSKKPVLVVPPGSVFPQAWTVSLLGAMYALHVPIELRDLNNDPRALPKVDELGVWKQNEGQDLDFALAVESGRSVARDIGGSDPERMAAPKVAEYITKLFKDSDVKVTVISDAKLLEEQYPLMAAVNRCAKGVERHTARVIDLEYKGQGDIKETLMLVGKGVTYDTGGADIKAGGVMAGMHRDKCGAAAVAGFFQTLAVLKPKGIKVLGTMAMVRNSVGQDSYVADEIITSAAGVRVRVGNTDAEGRMAMSDPLHHMKERARKEHNPQIITMATLTGHAVIAVGPAYTAVMDNGPAAAKEHAQKIQKAGAKMGDPLELSTIRREDYDFVKARNEYEDVLQCNNLPSTRTPRGHQFPAAFMIRASGLDKHGNDSSEKLCYTHMDIAGPCMNYPGIPTGAPIVALATHYLKKD